MRGGEHTLGRAGIPVTNEGLHEECGVVAVYSPEGAAMQDAFTATRDGMQHRGQEGSGFSYIETDAPIRTIKDLGLVATGYRDVLHPTHIEGAHFATGHVRYGTSETTDPHEALHPIAFTALGKTYTVAENGNLKTRPLDRLADEFDVSKEGTDAMKLARILGSGVERYLHLEPALHNILPRLEGAFNLAILGDEGVYAVTDRHHIRPFVIGRKAGSIMVASEVRALQKAGYTLDRETDAGTYLFINETEERQVTWAQADKKSCMFELTYFSKSENITNGVHVGTYRRRVGEALAQHEVDDFIPDIVVPVLGTAKLFAKGYSDMLGAPYVEALVKNKNANRTFIAETQEERERAVDEKFEITDPALVDGKKVVVVDDSVVRGTTIRGIVNKFKKAGASEVHFRIGSDVVVDGCDLGVNMSGGKELFVNNEETIEGLDSLRYATIEMMEAATKKSADEFCWGCFGGDYPETYNPEAGQLVLTYNK